MAQPPSFHNPYSYIILYSFMVTIVIGNSTATIASFIQASSLEFVVNDLGLLNYFPTPTSLIHSDLLYIAA